MIAYRKIKEKDYDSWINKLREDEIMVQSKHKLLERLYDIIENNLTLLGGTIVEDKLQDKVPETIKELRAAGIKIWVLTGDKLDTAENIGHSCNLLSKEQKLFVLKVMPGDDENIVKENPYREMSQFFQEFQDFIENLIKKYNLDLKYALYKRSDYDLNDYNLNGSGGSEIPSPNKCNISRNSSIDGQIIDFEIFKYLKNKNLLEPFSIIIEAPILCGLFKDDEWTENFLHIAYYSNTVICCRVSPSHKSQVIQKMKNFDKKAVMLAIGDGGNDVSMIMEANIGIGIFGEEGMSAVQASDFSIGEFKKLKRLLFIHGRVNLYRISKMILYFFFKNFIFTMTQFYFAFLCLGSGQTFIDDWYITCYNLIFTALPLAVCELTDSDIDLNNNKIIKKNLALLYKESRDNYKIFSFKRFLWALFKGTLLAFIIFSITCFRQILAKKGFFSNIWYLSLKCYICVLTIVSSNLLINTNFISIYLLLTILITTFLLFSIFLLLNHYGILFEFNSKASIVPSLTSPILYLSLFLLLGLSIVIDYSFKLFNIFFSNSLSSKIILHKVIKKMKNRISALMMNNIGSKSFSNNNPNSNSNRNNKENKGKIHINEESQEISNNYLITKMPNYFLHKIYESNLKKQYEEQSPNKNELFQLKFRGVNKIVNYNQKK